MKLHYKHEHYARYHSMVNRCYNKEHPRYDDWGGRGITVCQEWLDNPQAYADYIDSLEGREKGSSIDRIINDEGYHPGNLRWASRGQQALNRRKRKPNKKRMVKGYYWHKRSEQWQVSFCINGKKEHFGYYQTKTGAKKVADFARDLIVNSGY